MEVIHNFFEPGSASRSREEVRRELGLRDDEVMILHSSNLRPMKRIDLLLETVARIRPRESFKLVILAGASFAPFASEVRRLGLDDRIIVRENILEIEDYLQAADLGLITSESESFCLSILEAMFFGCPSVATRVGGIPEVVEDGVTGLLVPFGDADQLARAAEKLIQDVPLRAALGRAAKSQAQAKFSADVIVPRYEALYRGQCVKDGELVQCSNKV
jgi:glycosyltransferase involved in cell wall biosynthesis